MRAPGRWSLIVAILGSGIVFLDSTVVNVALPKIGQELPSAAVGVLEGQSYVYNAATGGFDWLGALVDLR